MTTVAGRTGEGAGVRILIVNADDFGMSRGVNVGVIEAHASGIVTSASLMVRRVSAEHAASLATAYPSLSVGLHVDLGEWELRKGVWHVRDWVVDTKDEVAVERELDRQLRRFRQLTGRDPTHLDSHQHVHLGEPVRSVLAEKGVSVGIPVRGLTKGILFCGGFYGRDRQGLPSREAITVDGLLRILTSLPQGVTELGCHPGNPTDLEDDYAEERGLELQVLCQPLVREELVQRGVRLASYREIRLGREAAWSGA